jgi:hypothetical protein
LRVGPDLGLGSVHAKDVEDRVILLELVKMQLTRLLETMSIGVQKMQRLSPPQLLLCHRLSPPQL